MIEKGGMLAFIVHGRRLVGKEKPQPKLRKGWALIRVRLAGICNTDIEILRGYHGFRGPPGHEFVGEVAEARGVSGATKRKWLGRRGTGETNLSCSAYAFQPVCDFHPPPLKPPHPRPPLLRSPHHPLPLP